MIADTFIKRPVTAIVISVVIVLVGLISMTTLPIAQYPEITPPTVSVAGTFTGADAQMVEQTTTTAIETQVNGTPGMSYMSSNSTSSGQCSITVTFDVGTNVNIATLDVQNRVSIAEPALPDAVKRLGLTTRKRNPSIMVALAFYSPNGTHDARFIGNYTNIFMKDVLQRVKGVGDIVTRGADFGMRIWINPDKLASLGLATSDVINALAEQNIQIAAGTVGGTPQPDVQSFEYSVITNSRLSTKEQFENIVVRTLPSSGNITYLRDVARVELGVFDYGATTAFVNGKPAAFLLIYQAPGANALETYDGVMATLAQLRKTFPKDIDYAIPLETASVVKVSISEVIDTLLQALALVVIVVFLFLQNWRATLIPVLAIPVSLIGTFILFIVFGFTINTLTLFAFVLAIGIVVDDAIVVVEAVQHNMDHEKLSPREATEKAMNDISGPVIAIALILAAVFVPVGFVPGIVGRLYQQFAITIAVSVVISAFVALSLTPALCTLMLKPTVEGRPKNFLDRFFLSFNTGFAKITAAYTGGVARWIKGTRFVLIFLVCLFVGLFFLFKNKPSGFIPTEDEGRFFVTYEMPEATSTGQSVKMMKVLMKRLSEIKAIKVIGGIASLNVISFSNKSNVGTLFITLHPWDSRKEKSEQIQGVIDEVKRRTADIKEARVLAIAPPAIPGLGQTAGFTFELQQTTSTDNIQQFERVARTFLAELNKRPEIGSAFTFFTARTPSYQVVVDRDKVKKLGVPLSEVYGTLSTLLGSTYVNDFNIYGRNFRVMAQADTLYRTSLSDLSKYFVRNSMGNMIPLNSLVSTKVVEAPSLVSHFNIYRSIEINGSPKPGFSSGEALDALREVAAQSLPAGYGYEFAGMSREEIKAGSLIVVIFAISIVFVFLFLAALYESWSVPFSVLFAVPVGAFGSILTLTLLPSLTNNVYAQIGLITLIGLAAKNAILIVEFAKERVDRGMDYVPATLEAVQLRLRPIVMTSLAFIFGVLPLAFSSGAGAEARKTIGWTVFGGMLSATTLAIFIVPVLYVLFTKLSYGKKAARLKEGFS
jgi:hydrophobic/amphiphilic exporter-1 (mainly G- bacteria), HAE1 family